MIENSEAIGTIESKENLNDFDSVIIYVFRHGECGGKEHDQWVENGNLWDPHMPDLTENGFIKVEQSAEVVEELVDPEKQIAVVLSSPRARTITTSNIISQHLARRGMEFFHDYGEYAPAEMVNFLRSRGDFANRYDPSTQKDVEDQIHRGALAPEIFAQKERSATGWRMLEFLNYCATFYPNYFKEKPQIDPYKGKQPVLFAFTHNEVLADMLRRLKLVTDLKTKATIPPGDFFELVCDLKNPGHFTVNFPDPEYQYPTAEIYIDPKTGEATSSTGGKLVFDKSFQTKVEDKTARDGQVYL
jgi:broad specificity phosphatase PhoE